MPSQKNNGTQECLINNNCMKTRTLLGVKISHRCGRGEIYDGRGMERKEGEEGKQEMGTDELGREKNRLLLFNWCDFS
jgi:hypothetical protein